jgi:hypothetical protein
VSDAASLPPFHPDAQRNFDANAAVIASSLSTDAPIFDDTNKFPVRPHVKEMIGRDDIIPNSSVFSQADHAGEEYQRSFDAGDRILTLAGDQYVNFRKLAESMQRTPGMRETVSLDTTIELLTEWLRDSILGKTKETASEYVLSKAQPLIEQFTILMPLYDLFIEEDFEVGRILFRPVTEQEIDRWVLDNSQEDDPAEVATMREQWKRKYQGHGAAFITVTAESKRAYEIARREAEDALAMLQVFSIGVLVPGARCYWTLRGSERVEQFSYLALQGDLIKHGQSGFYHYRNSVGSISKALLNDLKTSGLDLASELVRSPKRNDFQEHLLNALLMYSRASVQDRLSEKLLYILVALESFLSRGETEPIQQNLGERIAFTIGGSLSERKDIIRVTKQAYKLRSRFVHHGAEVDDLKIMKDFMIYAYVFFEKMLRAVSLFSTKLQFLDTLEDVKLTPPPSSGPSSST